MNQAPEIATESRAWAIVKIFCFRKNFFGWQFDQYNGLLPWFVKILLRPNTLNRYWFGDESDQSFQNCVWQETSVQPKANTGQVSTFCFRLSHQMHVRNLTISVSSFSGQNTTGHTNEQDTRKYIWLFMWVLFPLWVSWSTLHLFSLPARKAFLFYCMHNPRWRVLDRSTSSIWLFQ